MALLTMRLKELIKGPCNPSIQQPSHTVLRGPKPQLKQFLDLIAVFTYVWKQPPFVSSKSGFVLGCKNASANFLDSRSHEIFTAWAFLLVCLLGTLSAPNKHPEIDQECEV